MKRETEERGSLEAVFLQDHRLLTRGLVELLEAVEGGDLEAAVAIARRLDREAGPHIDFEERAFYPELRKTLGADFVKQLYHEHAAARRALRVLIGHDPARPLPAAVLEALRADLGVARDHALSCGTLTSHLALDPERERTLLARLREARERGRRWTELPPHGAKEP